MVRTPQSLSRPHSPLFISPGSPYSTPVRPQRTSSYGLASPLLSEKETTVQPLLPLNSPTSPTFAHRGTARPGRRNRWSWVGVLGGGVLAGVVLLSVAGAGRKYVAGGWVPLLMESVERERAVGLNPLDPTTTLQFDENVMVDDFEPIVRVGELATITFHCEHPDVALCAPAYRVFLSGPTLVSPLYSRSSERMDERHVRVSFELRDAGQYEMYAFAEHATCAEWTEGEAVPFHKLAVKGTPMQLTVEGSAPREGVEACSGSMPAGRWISKAHINPFHLTPKSRHYNWLQTHLAPRPSHGLSDYADLAHIYVPYTCKPQHRSFREWINLVKPASVLVLGDEILRDLFCQQYYADVDTEGEEPKDEQCTYSTEGPYLTSNKGTSYLRPDGLRTSLRFHHNPRGDTNLLEPYLASLPSVPTHIVLGVALALTAESTLAEVYVDKMRPMLEFLSQWAPDARIVARTSAGTVQAVGCSAGAGGGRRVLEGVNEALLNLLQEYPNISPVDVYPIFNDRPDATADGTRWQKLVEGVGARPEVGAPEFAATDALFEGWLEEKRWDF